MCSEKYDENLLSYTTGSNHVYTYEQPKPSSQQKSKKLTLFEDLLESSDAENSNSGTNVVDDSCPSDCESGVSGGENERQLRISDDGLVRIGGGEMIHGIITKKLISSLNSSGFDAKVKAVNRIDFSGLMSRAKIQSFCIYSRAVEMKCNGDANVKYAWYGASKREINVILSHGFCLPTSINRTHGHGVYLSPVEHPVESMQLSSADDDGLMHMLLCRVIMGKMETIAPNSDQYNPSSEEFDSGVDDLASPRKYIVWSSRMNTHILPEFAVSFTASSYQRVKQRNEQPSRVPKSDWMPFPTLIAALSKFLPPDAVESISKFHTDYRKQKVTRHEMIQRVRHIAGDKLLMAIIKSYRGKIKSSWNGVSRALCK
ncbi:hypothetical protein C2S51_018565 [Perilla frutescens var. frutescens]|nr:hypothetical protein C2S51_018565 [Perilla frutescens var. frutescens]